MNVLLTTDSLSRIAARASTESSTPSSSSIPSCIKSLQIWYPFKFTPRAGGGFGKPPCDRQGKPASNWQDSSTCMSFDEAYGLNMDGVGIVFQEEIGLTGIDFDHCVKDGVITDPWVAQKVKKLDSYTEYSVSGGGIHVLVWGLPSGTRCNGKLEMKSRAGFLTMSGNRVPGTPAEIRSAQGTIDALYLEVFRAEGGKISPNRISNLTPTLTLPSTEKKERGEKKGEKGTQKSYIQQAEKLNSDQWEKLINLQSEKPNFKATWEKSRSTGFWPFPSGRYTSSEYEMALASFLVKDGWEEQDILDAIGVWRRMHGFKRRMETCRYALTLARAFATVTPRLKGTGSARTPVQGLYRHGYTRDQILGSIIETPRTPKQISEVTGIVIGTVYVVLGRLAKDGKVIRDHHAYMCVPTAVPWYLQNIPEDAGEPTSEELEAQYNEWVAVGGLDAVEEEIKAPELEPVLVGVEQVQVYAPFEPWKDYRDQMAAWVAKDKLATNARLRENRKRSNYQSPAALKRAAKDKKCSRAGPQFKRHMIDEAIERINELTPQELAARENGDDDLS